MLVDISFKNKFKDTNCQSNKFKFYMTTKEHIYFRIIIKNIYN